MAVSLQLTDVILEPRGAACAIVLTDEQVTVLGQGKKVFPVTVTINGVVLALRLVRMGGENLIGLAKAARQTAGVEIGAGYDIEIRIDAAERTVEIPDDLVAALKRDP